MADSSSRDRLEAERLHPDGVSIGRRRDRDEKAYRDWCEASYGMIEIGPEVFHPADVLEALAHDAARRGRDDAATQVRVDLEQAICEQFPATIAIPFHGFLEGPRQALTRLHRLRDTWESLIRLLAAVALSEAALIGRPLAPLRLREGSDQGWRDCRRKDLLSSKLSVRIGLIEGVIQRAHDLGIALKIAALLPLDVIAEVRRLNVVRNGFAHEATKSDIQAQAIIDESYSIFRELLLDLRDIQGVELIRLQRILPGNKAEIERLIGHAQSRRVRELGLEPQAVSVAMSAGSIDGMDRVLARVDGLMLDMSPFLYAADDDTGHRTRILDFKCKSGDQWKLECVADSTTRSSPCELHESLLVRFHGLLGEAKENV